MTEEEIMRQTTAEMAAKSAYLEEVTADRILRELMVKDEQIYNLLAGRFFYVLDDIYRWVEATKQQDLEDVSLKESYGLLIGLLGQLAKEIERTQKFKPYLLILTHLTSLTNLSESELKHFQRRVNIMITRDMISLPEDEIELTDINFYEALRMLCHIRIQDSYEGWKAKIISTQRKEVQTDIHSESGKKRGLLGRFL